MKASEIQELLNEPACSHNKKSKSGCARPKPGATAGGCSFDGAQIALLPIADVAHIVHGPIACAGSSWDNRGTRSSGPTLYRVGMTTDLTEQDVIMGRGEKRLFHAIKQAVEEHNPAAVFVYNTCVPALIGDDIEAVCKAAESKFETAVVPVDAAGFYGTKNLGNRIAGEAMVKYVVGTREPEPLPKQAYEDAKAKNITIHDVNLIGEYNIAGELWHVLPLFDELGIRVLCTLSGDARFHEVQSMHRAEVNMMVCSKAMINVARKLQERYGTPWFEGSFYGVLDTSQALRDFAKLIGDDDLTARTEKLIEREEARIDRELEPWREKLKGKRVLLYTGGVKSWSVVAALQDLGMTVVATGTKKSTEEDKERIRELMGDDVKMIEDGNPRALIDTVHELKADMLIAGGRNMYTALKAKLPFLDINQERDFAYAGYQGMIELARQLSLTLNSPVWKAVRKQAPWRAQCPADVLNLAKGQFSAMELPPRAANDDPGGNTKIVGTEIVRRNKALSVSPLKSSQTIGAALAFMGLDRAMPMLHGSQGCTAFGKVFFVRHFREPVPLQTTAMDQVSAVMGSEDNIVEGLKTICSKSAPDIIGLPTTGLAETQGSYVERAVKDFQEQYPEFAGTVVVPVSTPDFSGCLETGFAAAIDALIDQLVPQEENFEEPEAGDPVSNRVNVLVGSALTPGDIEELKSIVESFGLRPVVLPDLSNSLDGRLTEADFSPLTIGGATVRDFATAGKARATLVIGASLAKAAHRLTERTGVTNYRFDHLLGMEANDKLIDTLQTISGYAVPEIIERQRAQLQDAMLDAHFALARGRIGIATDPDLLKGMSDFFAEMGSETVAAVAPANAGVLKRVDAPLVKIGDLEDLELMSRSGKANLVVGNSHVVQSASRLGVPILRVGFPQYDLMGGYQRIWVGYRGARQTLFDVANILSEQGDGEIEPYKSIYAQKTDECTEARM